MKKSCVLLALLLIAGSASAQMLAMQEEGSLLVFPLVDNRGAKVTILEITNRARQDVLLQGFMIERIETLDGPKFIKKDFHINITANEPFVWDTSLPYNRTNVHGITTQIEPFNGKVAMCFVWAVDAQYGNEIEWNYLKGDGIVLDGSRAYQYSAIPHQALAIVADKVLNLDGVEYAAAPTQIMLEGFAQGVVEGGTLAMCSLDIDFINSIQPKFDLNLHIYNEAEIGQSRHLDFYQFELYDLETDLELTLATVFSAKWQMAITATAPMWAVYVQVAGPFGIAANVWQHPDTSGTAVVVLPISPLSPPSP